MQLQSIENDRSALNARGNALMRYTDLEARAGTCNLK